MLKTIKNKFYFLEKLWKQTLDNQELLAKNSEDTLAMIQLLKMFPHEMFFPLTKWSLSPTEILHVCNDMVINKRKKIVELGGGFSTICIAQLIKIKKLEAQFFCIENNEEWAEELQQFIAKNNLSEFVKIIVAPLQEVSSEFSKEEQQIWYDTKVLNQRFANVKNIDLLLVDGPYGKSTPFARFSAVPFFKEKLSNSFTIFLDDTYREQETIIVNDWEKILNVKAENFNRYSVFKSEVNFNVSPFSNF